MSNTSITNLSNNNYITSNGNYTLVRSTIYDNSMLTINNDTMTLSPEASIEVKGKMILNGQDLEERLSTIEKVLHIPERDAKLEAKYPKLKQMYDDYIKELSKYRTWEILKGDNNE